MPLVRKSTAELAKQVWTVAGADALSALTSGPRDKRWAAARVLGAAPHEALALGQALSREPDTQVREAIFSSLIRASSAESVEAVLPHLRSDDAALRTGALDALRAMPEVVAPRVADLLSDPDPDVRLLACEIVRGLPGARATKLLCAVLEAEDEVNVCGAAVEVLAEIAGLEAISALETCAGRFPREPFLIFAIKAVLARVRTATGEQPG